MKISKITLGTAQLGLNYGIANKNGKPEFKEAMNILNYSIEHGINTFDTSPVYGNSEEIIGSFISSQLEHNKEFPIISSKLEKIGEKTDISFENLYSLIKKRINTSLKNLNIKKIPFYLLHHAPDIFLKDGIVIDCLNQLKEEGLIERIGISTYTPDHVDASLNFREISFIQVPINIFDIRLIESGLLKKLKDHNYIIFARSIYLQGLFFKSLKILPKYLKIAEAPLLALQKMSIKYNIDIANIALLFIRDISEIDSLIIGAEKVEQVADNLNILKEKPLDQNLRQQIFEEFSGMSKKIINPSLWNK